MPKQEDTVILATANVEGYDFWRREPIAREAFSRYRLVHAVAFQEITPENQSTFEQHGLRFLTGQQAGDFSNAIAYQPALYHEVMGVEWGTIYLSDDGTNKVSWDAISPRSAVWAILRRKNGGEFLFISAHFDNIGQVSRRHSIQIISEFITKSGISRAVLCGDLNMSIADKEPFDTMREPYDYAVSRGFIDAYTAVTPQRKRERTFISNQEPSTCGDDPYIFDPDCFLVRGWRPEEILNCNFDKFAIGPTPPSDHLWGELDMLLFA